MISIILIVLILMNVYSSSCVNRQINDMNLKKNEDFEYSIPSDTFENINGTSIFMSVSSNNWISNTYTAAHVVGHYPFLRVCRIICHETICYLIGKHNHLTIFDFSDPNDYQLLSIMSLPSTGCDHESGVMIIDDVLYIATSDFFIVNVSDSSHPFLISTIDLSETIGIGWGFDIQDNIVYIPSYDSQLADYIFKIYDISDLSSPTLLSDDLEINDNNAVVVNSTTSIAIVSCGSANHLKFLNVSDPANPTILGFTYAMGNVPLNMYLKDNLLYVSDYQVGIKILDVSVPASTVQVGVLDPGGDSYRISMSSDFSICLMLDINGKKTYIIDTSTKATPDLIKTISFPGTNRDATLISDSNFMVTVGSSSSFAVMVHNVTESLLSLPKRIALHKDYSGTAYKGMLYGPFLILSTNANSQTTLRAFDVSVPAHPKYVGIWDEDMSMGDVRDFWIHDGLIYVLKGVSFWTELRVLRLVKNETLFSPITGLYMYFEQIGSLYLEDSGFIQIEDDIAYISSRIREPNFNFVNISDPTDPKPLSFDETFLPCWRWPSMGYAIFVKDSIVYMSCEDEEGMAVSVYNTTNLTNIVKKKRITTLDTTGIVVDDGYLYISDGTDGLKIFDLSDLSDIHLGGLNTQNALGLSVKSNFVFISDDMGGMKVVDVSNPKVPEIVLAIVDEHFEDGNYFVNSLVVRDDYVYVSLKDGGFRILKLDMKLVGRSTTFGYFCGDTTVEIVQKDYYSQIVNEDEEYVVLEYPNEGIEECSLSFNLFREDFCHGRGTCLEDLKCSCQGGYVGDTCEAWMCTEVMYNSNDTVCSKHGVCVSPEKCVCDGSNNVGENCEVKVGNRLIRATKRLLTFSFELTPDDAKKIYGISDLDSDNFNSVNFPCELLIEIPQTFERSDDFLRNCTLSNLVDEVTSSYSKMLLIHLDHIPLPQLERIFREVEGGLTLSVGGQEGRTIGVFPVQDDIDEEVKKSYTLRSFARSDSSKEEKKGKKASRKQEKCKEKLMEDNLCIQIYECYQSWNGDYYFSVGFSPDTENNDLYYYTKYYFVDEDECVRGTHFMDMKTFSLVTCSGFNKREDYFTLYPFCSGGSDSIVLLFQARVLTFFFSVTSPFYLVLCCLGISSCICTFNLCVFGVRRVMFFFGLDIIWGMEKKDNEEEEEVELLDDISDDDENFSDSNSNNYVEDEENYSEQQQVIEDKELLENEEEEEEEESEDDDEEEEEEEGGEEIVDDEKKQEICDKNLKKEENDNSYPSTQVNIIMTNEESDDESDEENQECFDDESDADSKEKEEEDENITLLEEVQGLVRKIKRNVEEKRDVKKERFVSSIDQQLNNLMELFQEENDIIVVDSSRLKSINNSVKTCKCFLCWIFCCFCSPPCCDFFKSFIILLFILAKEGIAIWFSCSEFLDSADIDPTNDNFIILGVILETNKYIIWCTIVIYIFALWLMIQVYCERLFFDPLMFCVGVGTLKEYVYFRVMKTTFYAWFIVLNIYSYSIKFYYQEESEQMKQLGDSDFWLTILLPTCLLLFLISDVLGYNGVANHTQYTKLKKYLWSCSSGCGRKNKLPKVNISVWKLGKDCDVILEELFTILFLVDRYRDRPKKQAKELICKLRDSAEYGHLAWDFLDGNFEVEEIFYLKDFFFPEDLSGENYWVVFHHHRIISRKWIEAFWLFPLCCVLGKL